MPDGAVLTIESVMRNVAPFSAIAIALGLHVRCGIEDNLWSRKGERMTSVQARPGRVELTLDSPDLFSNPMLFFGRHENHMR